MRILESVSRELTEHFNVVAMVTDGHQALTAASRLEPDLIVLDVAMPGLDGFQTLRQLKRNGTRAKIVLLTMYESDEYVAKALECDAHGYVLKTRIRLDLVNALKHALADQFLVPQLSPLAAAERSGHAVLFYPDDRAFLDSATSYLTTALGRGDSIALFVTEAHRKALAERLQAQNWSVTELEKEQRYLTVDAMDAVSQVVRGGHFDADAVIETAARLEQTRAGRGPQYRLTILGELSPNICRQGYPQAAIQTERLWNDLTRSLPFLTVCAYPINGAGDVATTDTLVHICGAHSLVSHMADAA